MVHDAKDPHSVAFDLFDWITVEGKILEVGQILQLAALLQIRDIVSMHVQHFQMGEVQDLIVNLLEMVVAEVDPLQILMVPHHILEDSA